MNPEQMNTITIASGELIEGNNMLLKIVSQLPPELQKEYLPRVEAMIDKTKIFINDVKIKP